ncbi:hypothetical protein RRSWK_03488 [Rhodopirellula sp. SWK7]|nr:hypothetical protein RRSWK_03488 [Rhodopirellula sp. SWK7]
MRFGFEFTEWQNQDMHGRTNCVVFEVEDLSSVPRDVCRYPTDSQRY